MKSWYDLPRWARYLIICIVVALALCGWIVENAGPWVIAYHLAN